MPRRPLNPVLRYIRTAAAEDSDPSDRDLLERFTARHDEAAFAVLVRRHGPMVLRLCRRVLNHQQDAEDAFQATFLILSRDAGSLRRRESLGGWLYCVAYRVAQKARVSAARRSRHEGRAAPKPSADPLAQMTVREAHDLLDRELARLPDKFRAPLVLCYLEGLTRDEAAKVLGCPESTLKSRLEQARERLRLRLGARGLALSGALVAALFHEGTASAALPPALIDSAIKAAAGGATTSAVAALADGGLKLMFRTRTPYLTLALIGVALAGVGAAVLIQSAWAQKPPAPKPPPPQVAETADQKATRLGLRAHEQAVAFDKLKRLSYQVKYRHGVVDTLRAVDLSFDNLKKSLTGEVSDKEWIGWYPSSFSWDEKRFIWEMGPGQTPLNYSSRSWTATDAWERHESSDKASRNYVRMANPAKLWKHVRLFDYSYLRFTPHVHWWGLTAHSDQTMSSAPAKKATWKHLGTEKFGGETCDVVESALRAERLWVGQDSGHVRGVLSYRFTGFKGIDDLHKEDEVRRIAGRTFATGPEYGTWFRDEATDAQKGDLATLWCERCAAEFPANAEMNELVQFDDYQEVSPGVWLPFREIRTVPYWSETVKTKREIRRTELVVQRVRTDLDLSDRYAELLPKEGDQVQDQRFVVEVNLKYRADQTDTEILKLVDAEYKKRLEGQEEFKKMVRPIEAMVGKPAPALPMKGWVGGKRPEAEGKPYLLRFWATSCGPCKNDVPLLRTFEEQGGVVVGMHPAGATAEEVEAMTRDQKLHHATYLELEADKTDPKDPKIGGYPAACFPYYILVDARGRVAAHGFYTDLLQKVGVREMIGAPKDEEKK